MAMTGTLDEVLSKLYELYIDNRMNDSSTLLYLGMLKHPNGELVFNKEDALQILEKLKSSKE